MNQNDLSVAYFQHLKSIEDALKLDTKIDERISLYMSDKHIPTKTQEELKQELKHELKQDLLPEIRRIVRECLRTEPINIKLKF